MCNRDSVWMRSSANSLVALRTTNNWAQCPTALELDTSCSAFDHFQVDQIHPIPSNELCPRPLQFKVWRYQGNHNFGYNNDSLAIGDQINDLKPSTYGLIPKECSCSSHVFRFSLLITEWTKEKAVGKQCHTLKINAYIPKNSQTIFNKLTPVTVISSKLLGSRRFESLRQLKPTSSKLEYQYSLEVLQ